MPKKTEATILMETHLKELATWWEPEYQFTAPSSWRFDFALTTIKVAIEIDGGTWVNGRHNTGSGSAGYREKFNEAARLGWRILNFTPQEILRGDAIAFIKRCL